MVGHGITKRGPKFQLQLFSFYPRPGFNLRRDPSYGLCPIVWLTDHVEFLRNW